MAKTNLTLNVEVFPPEIMEGAIVGSAWVDVLEWNAEHAEARVQVHFEGFELGVPQWVSEAVLMLMTGRADDPALMVGRRYPRGII